MKLYDDAKELLDNYATDAANRSRLPEPHKTEGRLELHSHLYELARARAEADGSKKITLDHARHAIGTVGTSSDVDAAFFAGRRRTQPGAQLLHRVVAYGIDLVLIAIVVFVLVQPLLWFLQWLTFGMFPAWTFFGGQFFFLLCVAAFTAFEAIRGQTPGKMAMNLRVVGKEGGNPDWGEAVVRNITKGFPPLALIDLAVGYVVDEENHERITSRAAKTTVIQEDD